MRIGQLFLVISLLSLSSGIAAADSFSFTGTFTQDNQLEMFVFTAPTVNTVVRTWGYAGGQNFVLSSIPDGGFDPVLSLFDDTGGLLGTLGPTNDNGLNVCPAAAPLCVSPAGSTGSPWDSLIVLNALTPGGQYALVLSESGNFANGPTYADGFSQDGQANFTATDFPCGGTAFCDANYSQRTGNWAVDILNVGTANDVTSSGVPEPGTIFPVAAGIASLALLRKRRSHV